MLPSDIARVARRPVPPGAPSPSPRRPGARRALAVAVALLAPCAIAAVAAADAIDPTVPRTIVVGPPRGPAPSERLDARRTGRATTALPAAPAEIWRHNLGGGLDLPPVVDARGEITAALTSPEVVRLAPDGRELWRVRVGTSPAAAAPVLTSDGTVVIVTGAGQLVAIRPSGAIRHVAALGVRGTREADAAPVATDDGGVVVAAGRALLAVDADGVVRARATLDDRVLGGLVAGPDGVLATTEGGVVYAFRPPAAPRKLGSFGGVPRRGPVLADARTLLGVVDGRALVALDLATGASHVRVGAPVGALFDGPPVVDAAGFALVATTAGHVVAVDASGIERARAAIDRAAAVPDAGPLASFFGAAGADARSSPPLVVDAAGRVAFARANGRVGVLSPDGAVAYASDRACPTPIALVPAGDKRFALACRDGVVLMIGE